MPWLASIPLISPTTLFVTGSMMWMLSPAELVWMIRSFGLGAASEEQSTEQRTIPPKTMRHTRNTCLFVTFVTSSFLDKPSSKKTFARRQIRYTRLFQRGSKHKCFQCQPFRVVLRVKVLASAMSGITASLLRERMSEQRALHAAGHNYPLDQLEVLARLLFVPGCAAR